MLSIHYPRGYAFVGSYVPVVEDEGRVCGMESRLKKKEGAPYGDGMDRDHGMRVLSRERRELHPAGCDTRIALARYTD